MSSLDYLDLCRLCLVKDRVSVPIFEGEGDVRQIFLKIAACLPVKVAREDKLPKKICNDCVYKVELFYQFWNTTVNAEKQLLQWLGEVSLEDKQGYVTNVLNPSIMKQEQSTENRLDGNVMQQVSEHQNNMGMGMIDNMGLGIPMMISSANQQQITSVPMDTSSNSVQAVQAVPGPSSQTTHNQISQNQTNTTQQEDEEESSEDEDNSDDECDGDEGLPVKEESEEDPSNRTIEPTTFVNVSLACDEAGPSGLQQQKISDLPEMPIPQPADGDPKSGRSTIAGTVPDQGTNIPEPYQVNVPAPPEQDDLVPCKLEMKFEEDISDPIKTDPSEIISDCPAPISDPPPPPPPPVIENTLVEAMKTVLVPVRDPITRRIQTMLVPVETRDESGLNIIKSILTPVYGRNGTVAYDVSKVVVPIQPRVNFYQIKTPEMTVFNTVICPDKVNQGYCDNRVEQKRLEEEANKRRKEEKQKDVDERLWTEIRRIEEVRKAEELKRIEEAGELEEVKPDVKIEQIEIAEVTTEETAADASSDEDFRILDAIRNVCPLCQKSFPDEGYMRRHVRLAHKKPFKCDKCHKAYFTDFALEEHRKKHKVVSFHKCTVCQMHYKTALGLKNHNLREHCKLEPQYTCDYCGKRFKIKVNLKNHIDGVHINPSIVCSYCGVAVKHIQSHELKHELEKDKAKEPSPEFPCTLCSRKYKTWNTLENHMLLKHNDTTSKQKPGMLRTLCEKTFPTSKDFYQHVFKKPDQSNLHKCHICSRVFATEYNLRNHAIVHAQSFLCSHCGKSFSHNYTLKQHMRKHTGEKPYKCKVCLKAFTSGSSLNVHTFIHTGERPYVCDICGQKFTQRSSMMVHRRKQHGNLPPPPPLVRNKPQNNEH